jgi:predicted AAA+ superfamily ATPase
MFAYAKDVCYLADLEHAGQLDRIVRLLAAHIATEVNLSDLAAVLGIPLSTFRRYLPVFETTYGMVRAAAPMPKAAAWIAR